MIMTFEEIEEIRRALNTPEENRNYEKYIYNAEEILNKYEHEYFVNMEKKERNDERNI